MDTLPEPSLRCPDFTHARLSAQAAKRAAMIVAALR
jgi:hypothetical protein